MRNKAKELLETKIWLISYEINHEYCSPERIYELKIKNLRLLQLLKNIS